LLHHTGAKSGKSRISPLAYLSDGGRYVVFASKGGAPTNPDWYHNLTAHPNTRIEVGTDTIDVVASEARSSSLSPYPESPTASRASARLGKNSTRTTLSFRTVQT
jgi:deazaflavin-dependent oxidoreductase (nitroreductase family)